MKQITLILPEGYSDWEYALLAGIGAAFYEFDIRFITPSPGIVTSQGGVTAQLADGVESFSPDATTTLVIIGSAIWTTQAAPDLTNLLRHQHAIGGRVAGICGGTLALARAGLLDDTPHCSNNLDLLTDHAPRYTGQAHFVQSPSAVTANRLVTAPGTAPVSFTAEIFAQSGLAPEAVAQFRSMLAAEHLVQPPSHQNQA